MYEAKRIESKPRYVGIMDKVGALLFALILRMVVAPDGQDFLRCLFNRDNIRKPDPSLFAIIVFILIAGQI